MRQELLEDKSKEVQQTSGTAKTLEISLDEKKQISFKSLITDTYITFTFTFKP